MDLKKEGDVIRFYENDNLDIVEGTILKVFYENGEPRYRVDWHDRQDDDWQSVSAISAYSPYIVRD